MMTKEEIEAECSRLAPFHHNIALPHGLSTFLPEKARRPVEKTRISSLVTHAFPALLNACGGSLIGRRVLDVACNCGGFSLEADRLGATSVLGIDVVDHYLEQANFIKRAVAADSVEFRNLNIECLDPEDVGHFDVTFCFGILYHLENPVLAMKRLSSVTKDIMLVDTTVLQSPHLDQAQETPLWAMNFPEVVDPDASDASTSLWRSDSAVAQFRPNVRAVVALLNFLGFPNVTRIEPTAAGLEERFYAGRRVVFLAQR